MAPESSASGAAGVSDASPLAPAPAAEGAAIAGAVESKPADAAAARKPKSGRKAWQTALHLAVLGSLVLLAVTLRKPKAPTDAAGEIASAAAVDKAANAATPATATTPIGPVTAGAEPVQQGAGSLPSSTQPVSAPASTSSQLAATSAEPRAGLFRDARQLDAASATAAGSRDPRPSPDKPSGAGLFKDPRPIGGSVFKDERPLAAPSFRDPRALAEPSAAEPMPGTTTPPPVSASTTTAPPSVAVREPAASRDKPAAPAGAPSSDPVPPAAAPATVAAAVPAQSPQASQAPPVTAPSPPANTIVALAPPPLRVDAGACAPPDVTTEPLDGGRMRISVSATCRAGEAVQLSYGGAELLRKLDAHGRLETVLDCFAGTQPVELRFADGSRQTLAVQARDLDRVSKIAVIWRAPVNLDLHVFEYAARHDQPGHLWAKAMSSLDTARSQLGTDKRGHGFLSSADDEASLGDKVEVYTFLHSDEQTSGAIALALDYETRGELPSGVTCGQGQLAEIDFQVSMLPRGGQYTRQPGVLTRVDCGQRISREARLNQAALPGLRIRR